MKHKSFYLILVSLPVIAIFIAAFTSSHKKPDQLTPVTTANGFAVIELFTSEGCSSCPAADEAVARLLAKNKPNIYILSYHVDYWDKLSWKDPFSNASFTRRQNQYASAFGLNSIYTPQVVVNGATEFVGSEEGKLTTAIGKTLAEQSLVNISLEVKRNANLVTVSYRISGNTAGQLLNIALVQPEATVSIKRGENGGRTLRHVNIVRALNTVEAAENGSSTIQIPGDITAIPLQLMAYTQNKKTLHITAAEKQSL